MRNDVSYFDGDKVSVVIYDGNGPDYGDKVCLDCIIKYNEEEGLLQIFDNTNGEYVDSLSNVLFQYGWSQIKHI